MSKLLKKFNYKPLSKEEMTKRRILGQLVGPCADFLNPTRNDNFYSEQLWENVFNDDIMIEKIKNGVCFGELGHPEDRDYVDPTKVAIALREIPTKDENGHLIAVFDILDTPNGQILKTFCDYGSQIGVSSRGTGERDEDGNVIPDTFNCECWDAVLVPAVKSARLQYITESLNNKKLKTKLQEQINSASEEGKNIMKETLNKLGINVETHSDIKDSKEILEESKVEAINDGSKQIIQNLQETLKLKNELDEKVKSLQKELAVNNVEVNKLKEELNNYKFSTIKLSDVAISKKDLDKKVQNLEESLKVVRVKCKENIVKSRKLHKINEELSKCQSELKKRLLESNNVNKQLQEDISNNKVNQNKLKENYHIEKDKVITLNKNLQEKLNNKDKLISNYKTQNKELLESYIELKCKMYDIDKNIILSKISENMSIKDINSICENVIQKDLNYSKLSMNLNENKIKQINANKTNLFKSKELDDEDLNKLMKSFY